jgi:CHAT domain-containing protein/tetratricopeptide (TPR) repeat protein
MSWRISVPCPQCELSFYVEIWQIIDLAEQPGLRADLLQGKINLPVCPHCGTVGLLEDGFLVNDPECERVIFFLPLGESDGQGIQRLSNVVPVAFPQRKGYFNNPQVVSDWNELKRLLSEGAEDHAGEQDPLHQNLAAFFAAASWKDKRDVVAAHPDLLGEEADALIRAWITVAREQDHLQHEEGLTLARIILDRCRAVGTDAAFTELSAAMPIVTREGGGSSSIELPAEMTNFVDDARLEDLQRIEEAARDDPARLPELIALYQKALSWSMVSQNPRVRATVCLNLGIGYRTVPGWNMAQRFHNAITYLREALDVFTPEVDESSYATVQNELGLVYLDLPTADQTENLARAITCFQEALRFRTLGTDPAGYAASQNNLGMALSRLEDGGREVNLRRAVNHLKEALGVYMEGGAFEECAIASNNPGTAYDALAAFDPAYLQQAAECYLDALGVWAEGSPQRLRRASALLNLGGVYAAMRSPERVASQRQAIACYEEALRLLNGDEYPQELARVYGALGKAYGESPDMDPRERSRRQTECYRQALALLTPNTFPAEQRKIAQALGDAYLQQGDWDAAAYAYREAIVAHETLYQVAASRTSRLKELSQGTGAFNSRAYALARLARYDEAVVQAEAGRSQILAEALARDRALLDRVSDEDRQAFNVARERIRSLEIQALAPDHSEARALAEISTALRSARLDLAEVAARIRTTVPDFMPADLDCAAIAAAAAPNRPLVYLITTSQGSLALVVPLGATTLAPEHVVWLDEFTSADLDALLVRRDSGEEGGGYLAGQVSGDAEFLQHELDLALPLLAERLVGALAHRLAKLGFREATFIPGGRLSLLPLHTAVFETHSVAYAPSARALQAARQTAADRAGLAPVFLGIGNPLPNPQPLPFARAEVETVAQLFAPQASRVLSEHRATRAETQDNLPGATHLHFACHATFEVAEPLDSALSLSGRDELTLRDLLAGTLDLSSQRLAVLSACQTGITEFERVPDEVVGLPTGFLHAGIPGVVATLWPVNDQSTAVLVSEFYRLLLAERQDPATALARARGHLRDATARELAEWFERRYENSGATDRAAYEATADLRSHPDPADRPYADPVYWAGFYYSGP